jgi:hypothetical protein
MDWDTFVTTLMATGFATGAFVFLAKIFSKHLLSMDLERFKAELRANNEKELERLKADLRIAAFQQETTFARLHEKRAEVIAELYRKLTEVDRATKMLLFHDILSQDELKQREQEAFAAITVFSRYIDTHQIYFEDPLCDLLGDLQLNFMKGWAAHKEAFLPDQDRNRIDPKERKEAWHYLSQQVPPIRKEIETTFRKLLGLSPSSTTPFKAD